jgi:RNA polymerase sigma factor (sigma-70 family)
VLRTQSDERLTALARAGSEAGFEALVARHRRSLVRHCARILGDADAEEAVQEALVRAHAALRRGDAVRRAEPWLHTIAHNSALNVLRSRNARGEPSPRECFEGAGAEDDSLERRLELRELVDVVGSLPVRQRHAIVMRELEGRSYTEIAERLDASPGAVRQLLNRARSTLRDRLTVLLPWGPLWRWALSGASEGAAGTRIGALSDACGATVKVCAALIPAAALGVGGLSVAGGTGGSGPAPRASTRQRAAVAPRARTTQLRVSATAAATTSPAAVHDVSYVRRASSGTIRVAAASPPHSTEQSSTVVGRRGPVAASSPTWGGGQTTGPERTRLGASGSGSVQPAPPTPGPVNARQGPGPGPSAAATAPAAPAQPMSTATDH